MSRCRVWIGVVVGGVTLVACAPKPTRHTDTASLTTAGTVMSSNLAEKKTDAEWRCDLSPEQYQVLRRKGTERPFTGAYWNHKETGAYACAGCGQILFLSDTKYDSGSGWPSFWETAAPDRVHSKPDTSLGMVRTEILCSRCGGHLGHVFADGPAPTGMRYCVNSAALTFKKKE